MKIIVLPGLDGTGNLLNEFAKALGENSPTRVITYPSEKYNYQDLLVYISEQLPNDEYILIAESFSGPLGIEIAAHNFQHLKAVIFVATFARAPHPIPSRVAKFLALVPLPAEVIAKLSQRFVIGNYQTKEFAAEYVTTLKKLPKRTVANKLSELLQTDKVGMLKRIEAPMAYIMAENDLLVPSNVSSDFKPFCDDFIALEGPHFILQAKPYETAKLIIQFIEKHSLK